MRGKTRMNNEATGKLTRQPVHFEFHDTAARNVSIAGTFNDWHPEVSEMISMGSGKWAKDLELTPGTYEYRFVIDGKWVTDPRCTHTVPNAFGETNSLLIVPEPKSPSKRGKQPSVVAAVLA